MRIRIEDVYIVTMTSPQIIFGDVQIEGHLITKVGKFERGTVDKIIHGNKSIVMPGLINSHTHLGMSFFRNYADDLNLDEWLNKKIWPIEKKLTSRDVYYASCLSMIEMIKTGTTSFLDMYLDLEGVIKATVDMKMRGNLTRGFVSKSKEEKKRDIKDTIDKFKKWQGYDGRIKIGVGPHAIYTCDDSYLKVLKALALKMNTFLNIHLSETQKEVYDSLEKYKLRPGEYLDKLGFFGTNIVLAHGVYLNEEEMKLMDKENVTIVTNPSSNMKLASGIINYEKLKNYKFNVALGTDGASSNNNQNMFLEMKEASLLAKIKSMNPKEGDAYQILKMATVNGAKALGYSNLGKIEKGALADLIMIDTNNYLYKPLNNIYSALVYSETGENVTTSIINGEIVLENGQLMLYNKEANVYKEMEKRFKRLKEDLNE